MFKKYVVGFAFYGSLVLLVQKRRPEWQAGLWNGIGGVVEDLETIEEAMIREFEEETMGAIRGVKWRHFATEVGHGDDKYIVEFFATNIATVQTIVPAVPQYNDVGEPLMWRETRDLPSAQVVGNLRWLVPLAQDWRHTLHASIATGDDIRGRASW